MEIHQAMQNANVKYQDVLKFTSNPHLEFQLLMQEKILKTSSNKSVQ